MWQVIKQERAVSTLKRSIEKKAISHAYLFTGPVGVGKMMLAKSLAQALNCKEKNPPCTECNCCKRINELKHPDFQVIGLKSISEENSRKKKEISIEQIKILKHDSNLPPYEGDFKIFVIDGAENMSVSAANCLLKTLEEPAEKIIIILLVRDENLLPPTVLSRCQKIELKPVTEKEAVEILKEHFQLNEEKANLVARLGHGKLGRTIEMAKNDRILEQRNNYLEKLISLLESDYNNRFEYSAIIAADIGKRREVITEMMEIWLDCWRDLILCKTGMEQEITNVDRMEELKGIARGMRIEEIENFTRKMIETERNVAANVNPRLALEVLMLEMPLKKEVVN